VAEPASPPSPREPSSLLARVASRGSRRGPRPTAPPGPWVIVAAWGPCGFAPVAPGTFGTLGAIPAYWLLHRLPPALYVLTLVAFVAVGSYAAGRAGRYWGVADASPIVIDEVAGYLVTMAFVPFSPVPALLGFALFRVFDVLKPWPASAFDRVKNGFGVVMDDVAAGVYAWATLQLVALLLRHAAGCGGAPWWCASLALAAAAP
jgi:phosphatidylglycerophosphatase A